MEPVESEVISMETTITAAGPGYDIATGKLVNHYIDVLGAKLWLSRPSTLVAGDRVRITITKEPVDV